MIDISKTVSLLKFYKQASDHKELLQSTAAAERRNLCGGWSTAQFPIVNDIRSLRMTFQQTPAEQIPVPLQAKLEIHSIHFLVLTQSIVLMQPL